MSFFVYRVLSLSFTDVTLYMLSFSPRRKVILRTLVRWAWPTVGGTYENVIEIFRCYRADIRRELCHEKNTHAD